MAGVRGLQEFIHRPALCLSFPSKEGSSTKCFHSLSFFLLVGLWLRVNHDLIPGQGPSLPPFALFPLFNCAPCSPSASHRPPC